LDNPFYSLLATGNFGAGTVSCFLGIDTSIQVARHCGRWLFGLNKGHHHAAGKDAAALIFLPISFYKL